MDRSLIPQISALVSTVVMPSLQHPGGEYEHDPLDFLRDTRSNRCAVHRSTLVAANGGKRRIVYHPIRGT